MKSNLIIIIAFITMLACNKKTEESPYSNFIPNGNGIVRFHSANCTDTNNYVFWYNSQLPTDQHKRQFSVYSDTVIEYKIEASFPVVVNFNDNKTRCFFMVLPNDTLNIYLDPKKDKPLSDWVGYKGTTGIISTYLTKSKVFLYDIIPSKLETPIEFNKRMDSLKLRAFDTLTEFNIRTKLPDWYMKYEKANIVFTCEHLKCLQYNQRLWKYNQFIEKEQNNDKNLEVLLLKNEWMSDEFFSYLSDLKENKFDTLLTPQNVTKDIFDKYTQDNISKIRGKLSPKMLSYFVASKISVYLWGSDLSNLSLKDFKADSARIEGIFETNKSLITDTVALHFITKYKIEKLNRANYIKKISKGMKAPGFYLKDIVNKGVQLSDFKGKLVCLNFWATWCGPCINSIPKKNELVKNYGAKNFVLLNICIDNNSHAWKEIIKTRQFKGIHLQCPGTWAETLREKYSVGPIPHYTLIDKTGNIIIDDINRDSLEYYVEANL